MYSLSHASHEKNNRDREKKLEKDSLSEVGGLFPNSSASGPCREAAEIPTDPIMEASFDNLAFPGIFV